MGKWEDIIDGLRDEGSQYVTDLEAFSATNLRQKASKADELERERNELLGRVNELETLPKKQEALRSLGVDFEALRPAELELIKSTKVSDVNEEWASKFVDDNKLPVGQTIASEGTLPNAAGVVQTARQAPVGGTTRSGAITTDTAAEWSQSDRILFAKTYPDAWRTLKDGGTVTGIAFP